MKSFCYPVCYISSEKYIPSFLRGCRVAKRAINSKWFAPMAIAAPRIFFLGTAQFSWSVTRSCILPIPRPAHSKLAGEILRKTVRRSLCALLPASSCLADKKWLALRAQLGGLTRV